MHNMNGSLKLVNSVDTTLEISQRLLIKKGLLSEEHGIIVLL